MGQSGWKGKSVSDDAERVNKEVDVHTNVSWGGRTRGQARGGAESSGEQRQEGEGVKRRRQDMFSKLPLMCQKAYKAAFRLAKPTKSVGTVDWCVDGPRIPSLVGDHNRTSTPRTRLRTHQRYRKRQ